jgi:hypothetical protein
MCGGGDTWIKTCISPNGTRLTVCDLCWAEHADDLIIVPGDRVVAARCDSCGAYGNPREFSELSLGGRKGAYSGVCPDCTEDDGREEVS